VLYLAGDVHIDTNWGIAPHAADGCTLVGFLNPSRTTDGRIRIPLADLFGSADLTGLTFEADEAGFTGLRQDSLSVVRIEDEIVIGYVPRGSELSGTVCDTGMGVPSREIPVDIVFTLNGDSVTLTVIMKFANGLLVDLP
jgi:hypothetical protein